MTPASRPPAVFLFGSLRSGTTLLRLMVDAHPDLANPGETDFLFDHLDLTQDPPRYDLDALRFDRIFKARDLHLPPGLDGLDLLADMIAQLSAPAPGRTSLNIHRHPERVVAACPNARIVHLVRDPRDVARSSIGMGWAGTLFHGVGHWIETEKAWARAAAAFPEDQVLELRYEALVRDPEPELRRLCAFLGVEWNPGMLDFHETSTYAPVDAKLAEQWRRKSSLREIRHVEARAAPLMERLGYALAGGPTEPPGLLERAALAVRNKTAIWRFGMDRLGARLFWAEKLARFAGLKTWHRRLQLDIQHIQMQHLK
ncbi:MAG: sulfotransferase [Pseudomonadota bacterium]